MSGLVIGVDAGGTRTRVRIVRDGSVVAEGHGRAAAVRPGGALTSSLLIAETIRTALTGAGLVAATADVLVVGAAGVGREPERDTLAQALRAERLASRVLVTTDVALALHDAFGDGPGVLLSAGTGSIAVAQSADGTRHRAGGWGWQVGDEGSGAWLGREAVRLVLRMRDGRSAESPLHAAIIGAARLADDDALVRWGNSVGAAELATLAPVILAAADAGDAHAVQLRAAAAAALSELAHAAARSAATDQIALSGGLLQQAELRALVIEGLAPLEIRLDAVDPLRGAIALAAR